MAFKAIKQYKIAIDAGTTALQIPEIATLNALGVNPIARMYSSGGDAVFKFGVDNTVAADKTVTAEKYADGNVFHPDGSIETFDLKSNDAYISVISNDAVVTGYLYMTIGFMKGQS